jgi:hypothetical protein
MKAWQIMLNEKKIKMMTDIAIFEKHNAKEIDIAAGNFKADYITLHMVYTALTTTLGYMLLVAIYVLGHLEELLVETAVTDILTYASGALKYYVYVIIFFLAVSLVFYNHKYNKSFEKVKYEFAGLKNLQKMTNK